MNIYQLERLISGGQTGIDQLGLEVAKRLGIPTGGVAPKGYLTETGPNSLLRDHYSLTEHTSASYPPRTRSNVQQSDGTVLFGKITGGTKLTVDACVKEGKPYIVNPIADQLRAWLVEHQIKVLNVAGNRGSSLTEKEIEGYRSVLINVLTVDKRLSLLFEPEPEQWGGRGDPHLWNELAQTGQTLLLPDSATDLSEMLLLLIKNLTGEELLHGKEFQVARYRFGGMSSGVISADFWIEEAIPLLRHRLILLQEGSL